ncbi:flagellar motor protein MotB [Ruegeria sp. 2205SS24-7]|uniref:flagellar motor protein MotB n=1 Tax=Ruegeria discodermiae TaxID=3064389 RepID=UPI00274285D7|nr:flagellar motor protein MotB [Ruegeria sp. 2205SS24-7]MDP5219391.1 flagellar motor protein MotB [Ruegeria sp. 2205SS24-7]
MGAQSNAAPVIVKRKKVVGGGGHHGGAWKVAYADFVTAMMAFFMLMWLLNATTEKQRKGLADYFSPSIPLSPVSGGGDGAFGGENVFSDDAVVLDGRGAIKQHLTESRRARGATGVDRNGDEAASEEAFSDVQNMLQGRSGESQVSDRLLKHIVTRVTDEGLIIELSATDQVPLFDQHSDRPTATLRELTALVAKATANVTNNVAVAAHVQARPVVLAHSPVWDLSMWRATAAKTLLEQSGLDPARIQRVTGHADRKLQDKNPMAARNNRIEITLLRDPSRE